MEHDNLGARKSVAIIFKHPEKEKILGENRYGCNRVSLLGFRLFRVYIKIGVVVSMCDVYTYIYMTC